MDQDQKKVHTVCLYAKIGLESLQEYSVDDINDVDAGFLGILSVKYMFWIFIRINLICI